MNKKVTMDKLVSLAKRRGFVYPGSDIYGGLANTWDYGPLGVEFKSNIKRAWWRRMVTRRLDMVGLDSSILLNPKVWEASGHLNNFNDPLMDCKVCKARFRGDHLIEAKLGEGSAAGLSMEEIHTKIMENKIKCPTCGSLDYTQPRPFNMMFKTEQGVIEGEGNDIYLRPETAQGIFLNFKNLYTTSRKKIPFGVAQIGKSFRNEITPGNFIFRTREFEQMEMEFFCKPGTELEWYAYWRDFCKQMLLDLGIKEDNMRLREHEKEELSHYSNATVDIEYEFPFGWGELWGVASRTDFDLKQHIEHSTKDLSYFDPESKEKFVPFVIEPAVGVERLALMFLSDAYDEEDLGEGDVRTVLRLSPELAPIKIAVLPLMKKLSDKGLEVYNLINKNFDFPMEYDESGNIGKRYRRYDEIGTPFCVTVDFETLDDAAVTVRERDTMQQERVKLDDLVDYFRKRLSF